MAHQKNGDWPSARSCSIRTRTRRQDIWRKTPTASWRSLVLSYTRRSRRAGTEDRVRKHSIKCTMLHTRSVSLPTRSNQRDGCKTIAPRPTATPVFEVTRHPTAEWLARQITEAFPWGSAPAYLVRDNRAYGHV